MSTIEKTTARHEPMTNADYHADREHDSASSLRIFERSPREYYERRVTRRLPDKPPTDAQSAGTLLHLLLLEPNEAEQKIIVIPRDVLSSNGAKIGNKWAEWSAANADKLQVKQCELDAANYAAAAVWLNSHARELLKACHLPEHTILWEVAGMKVKCRLDTACTALDHIVDLKFTVSPGASFYWQARDFRYDRQAALYIDGYNALFERVPEMFFITVGKEPPHDCFVWKLPEYGDAVSLASGRASYLRLLDQIDQCRKGERQWFPEGYDEIRELRRPGAMEQEILTDGEPLDYQECEVRSEY
jgi:hypothetical protein